MTIFGCEALDRVVPVTGCVGMSTDGYEMYFHYQFPGQSDTFTAGDSFIVGSFKDDTVFASTDDVAVSWVFEIGTGSGTIRVSSGLDPSWDLTSPGLATDDLGPFAVAGPQRLVCGPTALTAADLTSFSSEPFAFVEVLDGTIEIIQIKLQIWAASGPTGAWVSAPSYQRAGRVGSTRTSIPTVPVAGPFATAVDAFAAHHTAYEALAGTPQIFENDGGSLVARMIFRVGLDIGTLTDYNGFTSPVTGYLFAQESPIDSTGPGVTSVGWDPREIADDIGVVVRAVGGGRLMTVFDHWEDTVQLQRGLEDPGFFSVQAVPEPEWGDSISTFPSPPAFVIPWQRPTADVGPVADTVSLASLGLAGDRVLYFGAFTTGFVGPPGAVEQQISSIFLIDKKFTDTVPPYEYWDAGEPWVEPIEPRFFVKKDGVMRPVGYGKPADEEHVFMVPTPVGFFRDMTAAEYALYPVPPS